MDNQAALKQLGGAYASKAKHLDLRIKFVVLHAKCGILKTEYCESSQMSADMMTKVLHAPRLEELKSLIGLHRNTKDT